MNPNPAKPMARLAAKQWVSKSDYLGAEKLFPFGVMVDSPF